MQVIEILGESESLSLRQRWANVFTILLCVFLLLVGVNLRNQIESAETFYESPQAGISAYYPQNWLLETTSNIVLRVRDMTRTGFKTTYEVIVRPVGPDATERNIADRLTLDRFDTLTAYQVLPLEPYELPNGYIAQAMNYHFVASESSPFLDSVPRVVRGLDILIIQGGQAIIVTFLADATLFDEELVRFEQFVRRLEF